MKIIKTIQNIYYMVVSQIWYMTPKNKYKKIKMIDDIDTINNIINEKKSIARFGDGELKIMEGIKSKFFQKNDLELAKRLKEVLESKNENILIGLPGTFKRLDNYTTKAKVFWKIHMYKYRNDWEKYIDLKKEYCNASMTRCYIDYKDKSCANEKFNNLMRIWKDKKICIIEGKDTKMGVGNNLLKDASEVKRIIAPSTDAFDKYDEIISEAKKINKEYLILIALGPTATVLAYDLANYGYQAIDIGHVDVEYEWFLNNAKEKIAIQGKYVNEIKKQDINVIEHNIENEQYKESIIATIIN